MSNWRLRYRFRAIGSLCPAMALGLLIAVNDAGAENQKAPTKSQQPGTPGKKPYQPAKWQDDIAKYADSFHALFKPGNYGAGVSEVNAWQYGASGGGQKRITQLQNAIKKYPDSPYADDAALLLARAYFLYDANAEKAIAGLYEVIKKYPEGEWIAEDPVVLDAIAPLLDMSRGGVRLLTTTEAGVGTADVMPYMAYASEHPNLTDDEAKVCIAWIIFAARLDQRYKEAEDLLRSVIARYRDAGRTQADLKAGEQLKNDLIEKELPRTERDASQLLVALLKREGNEAAANKATEEYAKLFEGHPSVERLQGFVRNLEILPNQKDDSK